MARSVKRKLSDFVSFVASFLIVWLGGPHSIARSAYDSQSGTRDAFPRPHVSAAGMPIPSDPGLAGGLSSVSTGQKYYVAQYGESGGAYQPNQGDPPGFGLSRSETAAVADAVTDIATACEALPLEYRIDCLGKGLTLVAHKVVPSVYDYRDIRHELRRAGNRLRSIAHQNRDPAKPVASRTQTVGRQVSRTQKYRPVKEEILRQATEEAFRVIEEAQTRLLRSGESSERRRVHYQAVSRSLGSTTRILRS